MENSQEVKTMQINKWSSKKNLKRQQMKGTETTRLHRMKMSREMHIETTRTKTFYVEQKTRSTALQVVQRKAEAACRQTQAKLRMGSLFDCTHTRCNQDDGCAADTPEASPESFPEEFKPFYLHSSV